MNEIIEQYFEYLEIKTFKKNEIIFNEGTICKSLNYILNGSVKIITTGFEEREFIISHIKANSFFGEALIFSNNPNYLGYVIAATEVTIIFIAQKNLLFLLQNCQPFLIFFMTSLANKNFNAQKRIKVLSQKTIRSKIMFYLENERKITKSPIIKIKSKEALANFLNIPRPSLSRELMYLKQEQIIDYSRHVIILKNK